jgi:murein DD-endopeptidase MepM/ murein hydrolase activator NlpD
MKVCKQQWADIRTLTGAERDAFVEHAEICEYHDKLLTEYEASFLPMLKAAFGEIPIDPQPSRVTVLDTLDGTKSTNSNPESSNRNYYLILLSHTSKSKIYIRRIRVNKKLLNRTVAGLILMILFFGAIGGNQNHTHAEAFYDPFIPKERKSIDYSRPARSENFAINSGGQVEFLQMTKEELDEAESSTVHDRIRAIVLTSNPSNVPTMWAHLGKINNEFGFRRNPFGGRNYEFHAGMDIDGERGDSVIAPANGTIIKAGWHGGYGNMIEIDHGNGLTTRYGHLSEIEIQVGDSVLRGQLIGLVGSTGRSTGPHLHYELRLNDKSINPRLLLPPEPEEVEEVEIDDE